MATTDNDTLHRLYDAITVGSKQFSGIVGDQAHAASGGYHIGRAFVPRSDYSAGQGGRNASPRDDQGDAAVACAIDVSFSTADMITVTNRLLAACLTAAMRGVREFNGTADGRTTLNRDAVLGWRQNYTPDPTHLWHVHIGFFRDTAQDWDVISDVAAVINGTPVHGTADNSATQLESEEDDMFSDADRAQIKWITDRLKGVTPNGVYFVMDGEEAEAVPEGTPNSQPVALLNQLDGNNLQLKLNDLSARLAAIEAAIKPA